MSRLSCSSGGKYRAGCQKYMLARRRDGLRTRMLSADILLSPSPTEYRGPTVPADSRGILAFSHSRSLAVSQSQSRSLTVTKIEQARIQLRRLVTSVVTSVTTEPLTGHLTVEPISPVYASTGGKRGQFCSRVNAAEMQGCVWSTKQLEAAQRQLGLACISQTRQTK